METEGGRQEEFITLIVSNQADQRKEEKVKTWDKEKGRKKL